MSVLQTRLSYGSILVALVALLFWLDRAIWPAGPSTVAIILLALGAQLEMYLMARDDGQQPNLGLGLLFGLAWLLGLALEWPREHLLPMGVAALLVFGVLSRNTRNASQRLAATLLGFLVVPLLLGYLIEIRQLADGWAWLIFVVAVSKAGDSAAFFVGSAIGRHKLIPEISPNKSWEGAIASVLGALLAGAVVSKLCFAEIPVLSLWIPAALVCNLGAQFGDLSESLLKRGYRSKDSASILPAFGGMFDLVDSFLLAAPALYAYLSYTAQV
jgi:phosphatidate cytidylyltransferase